MIGYDRLGSNGRLGNQLFQYCALRGIASHHGYEWCIPPEDQPSFCNYGIHQGFKLKNLTNKNIGFINQNVSLQACNSFDNLKYSNPSTKNVVESFYYFDKNFFENVEDGSNLDGYFQSEKYFKHIENDIRDDLEFKDDILNPCKKMMESVNNVISLHIRRTDYVQNSSYVVLGLDYYEKSLSYFDKNFPVLIFSDDSEWCKKQELFSDDRFMISESENHYVDLCLMSLCKYHIIANSTFSWWGAWLAKSEKVIAPSEWFGLDNQHLDTRDLYLEDWIKL